MDRYSLNKKETLRETCDRIAKTVAERDPKLNRIELANFIYNFDFLPGGRIWSIGSGQKRTLFNCFVLDIKPNNPIFGYDSKEAIMDTLKKMVHIMSLGGGMGLTFAALRPKDCEVKTIGGSSSGILAWLTLFDAGTGSVKQGGSRKGALMGVLPVWHPDILDFINEKQDQSKLTNVNLSIGWTDEFQKAIENDEIWNLEFPDLDLIDMKIYNKEWDGDLPKWKRKYPTKIYQSIKARELFYLITQKAWETGDPGIIHLDEANRMSNSYYYNTIKASNPCGEQMLPDNGICLLGHINLSNMFCESSGNLNTIKLKETVKTAIRFLDNVIDFSEGLLPEQENNEKQERRIGLGTLGLAELLIKLNLKYGSPESLKIIEYIYEMIRDTAYETSIQLSKEKGPFPLFKKEEFLNGAFIKTLPKHILDGIKNHGIRNVTLLTQAPTGTVGTMAGTSTGIEPYFAFKYSRTGQLGTETIVEPIYEKFLETTNPDELDFFVTASEIDPLDHIKVQTTIQKYTDASISKTINLPHDYDIQKTRKIFLTAMQSNCKGLTIYRDGSKNVQVLTKEDTTTPQEIKVELTPEGKEDAQKLLNTQPTPPITRGKTVYGKTEKLETPIGKLYVTTNTNEKDEIVEVFVNGPDRKVTPGDTKSRTVPREDYEKVLSELAAMNKVIGILISESLKWGASAERIAEQLCIPISNPYFFWDEEEEAGYHLRSIPATIALSMLKSLNKKPNTPEIPSPIANLDKPCPKCNTYMTRTDCWLCTQCGFSQCG